MPHPLVDRLAQVSSVRDLEQLDMALVRLLHDTLAPLRVQVLVSVREGDAHHWLLRAHQEQGAAEPSAGPAHTDVSLLPRFEEQGLAARCARSQLWQQERSDGQWHSVFPLFADPDSLGVLQLATRRPLSERRQRMLFSLLRFYANFRSLVTENERDMLTGLLNRKTFDETFARVAMATTFVPQEQRAQGNPGEPADDRRAAHAQAPCWLVVADIDHFKRVNDQFGHLIGDEVLLLTARLMHSSFRYSDRVFRFGGEEFVLMLRNADAAGAQRALEKFRQRIAAHAFPQIGAVTISLGCTRIDPDDTPDSAFERADKAVYAAKADGRNRVYCFEDLVLRGRLEAQEKAGSVDFF
ncbi:diguanylate cyclase (GGDEF)-like protein [Inhella inkyongensis]|uniref:diguanylate cyclase n=1 Tax=Inhella inkyongensis TaxID=392593 RepID=A0A840S4C1_9BURK|nr:GGDEF domain-containing protein [Inhella inkyongensis]MBB5203664.1 diguanylate cyclase (GGDEF)-like protein [Inhella inkyongensis]